MKLLSLSVISLLLGGCEVMQHTAVAPRALVEGCIAEAYPASHQGWGPMCSSLNEWMKLHSWYYAGGPPNPTPLTPEDARKLEGK